MEWLWKILVELVIGGLCGFVASKLLKVSGKKWWFYIIVGLIGGVVGGVIGNLIGIGSGWVGWVLGIILSIVGSCLIVWLYKKFIAK